MKTYIRRQVPFKVLDDLCYIIDSFETKAAYKLNETSTALWLYLAESRNMTEILTHLEQEFEGVPRSELEKDVEYIISEFINMSLIHET